LCHNTWWTNTIAPILNDPEFFITSFAGIAKDSRIIEDDGLLSQWRGYATNNGVAILFHSDKLLRSYNSYSRKCKKHSVPHYDTSCEDCKNYLFSHHFIKVVY